MHQALQGEAQRHPYATGFKLIFNDMIWFIYFNLFSDCLFSLRDFRFVFLTPNHYYHSTFKELIQGLQRTSSTTRTRWFVSNAKNDLRFSFFFFSGEKVSAAAWRFGPRGFVWLGTPQFPNTSQWWLRKESFHRKWGEHTQRVVEKYAAGNRLQAAQQRKNQYISKKMLWNLM